MNARSLRRMAVPGVLVAATLGALATGGGTHALWHATARADASLYAPTITSVVTDGVAAPDWAAMKANPEDALDYTLPASVIDDLADDGQATACLRIDTLVGGTVPTGLTYTVTGADDGQGGSSSLIDKASVTTTGATEDAVPLAAWAGSAVPLATVKTLASLGRESATVEGHAVTNNWLTASVPVCLTLTVEPETLDYENTATFSGTGVETGNAVSGTDTWSGTFDDSWQHDGKPTVIHFEVQIGGN